MKNVTEVSFGGLREAKTTALYQYDYGQILKFTDLDLPQSYEVHFGTNGSGTTITQIGDEDGVTIPDSLLRSGASICAYVFLHEGEDDGETEYKAVLPVLRRPQPSDEVPTPVEQSAITQAIAALNVAVEDTASLRNEAETFANNASGSADIAEEYKDQALTAKNNAQLYATNAATSASNAHQSEVNAKTSEVNAKTSEENAKTSELYALEYANRAEQVANVAGYLDVEINAAGHLIYTRTAAVDVDFVLRNGHLIMEAI